MIRESATGDFLVIDVNSFPGYHEDSDGQLCSRLGRLIAGAALL